MHFSGTVIISLLFYHGLVPGLGSLLREKSLSNDENILEQFFAATKIILDNDNPRHITVLGASNDQLRRTKSLLEAFPYFVGSDANEFCASRENAPNTLMIYFLLNLEEEYVTKVAKSLSNCKKSQIYFIFEGIAVNDVDIESVLGVAFQKITKRSIFILYSEKSLKLYGYEMKADCSRKAELLINWKPGTDMTWMNNRADHLTHKGCPVSIGTIHRLPWMNIAKDTNGVKRIVGGLEGHIISTVAQMMNFTPLVQQFYFTPEDASSKTEPIVSSCAAGNIDIGIGHIRPTESVIEVVDVSQTYAAECMVWCVPRIIDWKSDVMTCEFSWSIWVLILLIFLANFVVEKIARGRDYLTKGRANKSGCCRIILDLIGSTLGNPIIHRPISRGGKFLLIIYLCYSTVITTAYKTALSSILTVENRESSIVNEEGIIKADLTTCGHELKRAILEEQKEGNEWIPELIKRFVIDKNTSKVLRQISDGKKFALLTSLIDINYHKNLFVKAGEHASFDVLKECVLSHGTAIVHPKSSQLTTRINQIILRLASGGLLDYWIKNDSQKNWMDSKSARSSEMMDTEEEMHRFTRDKFYYIFHIYCLALIFCTLVFFGELLVHKFKVMARLQRFRHSKWPKVEL